METLDSGPLDSPICVRAGFDRIRAEVRAGAEARAGARAAGADRIRGVTPQGVTFHPSVRDSHTDSDDVITRAATHVTRVHVLPPHEVMSTAL